jgi:secreted trypsin-like serine protease
MTIHEAIQHSSTDLTLRFPTTAHCVYGYVSALSFEVAVNFTSHADLRYAYPRNVSQIVMHQKYDPIFLFNDIALLFLDVKVTRVTPIKLNTDAGIPIDDEILKAIGAGATTDFGTTYPTDLWEVNLPKVNNDKCNSAYTPIGFPAGETRILCAGYDKGGKTTCFGDSGTRDTVSRLN